LIATDDSCNRTYLVATNEITIRYEALLSSITANVESSRCDKKADNLSAADELRLKKSNIEYMTSNLSTSARFASS
jgi:hypothetical protein